MDTRDDFEAKQAKAPSLSLAFHARISIGEFLQIGPSKYGLRQLVPITGGTVRGPMLTGEVVPGGADWQLLRSDGVLELDARYTIRAEDGALIHVRNRGLFRAAEGEVYVRTVPQFEAPVDGPHAELNRAVFIASAELDELTAVEVTCFKVT